MDEDIVINIAPLKEGAVVQAETAMAGRFEEAKKILEELKSASLCPVYEIQVMKRS